MGRGKQRLTIQPVPLVAALLVLVSLSVAPARAEHVAGVSKTTAIEIPALPFETEVTFSGDQASQVSPSCTSQPRSGSGARWFRYTPSEDVSLVLQVRRGTNYDAAYSTAVLLEPGPSGDREVACTQIPYWQPYGKIRADLRAGVTYHVVLSSHTYYDDEWERHAVRFGDWHLIMERSETPPNDEVAQATPVGAFPFTSSRLDLARASFAVDELRPSCGQATDQGSAWFRIQAAGRPALRVTSLLVGSAVSLRSESGDEIDCRIGAQMRFRVPAGTTYLLQVTGADVSQILVEEIPPAPNDDFSHAPNIRTPNVWAAKVLPTWDRQDGALATLEPGEPTAPGVIGSLWWVYYPDNHTYISVRNAECCAKVDIRVFEAYNRVLGREVEVDRSLTNNGTVRWLATGGTPYAVQFGMRSLGPVVFYATLNPQGVASACNTNSCIL